MVKLAHVCDGKDCRKRGDDTETIVSILEAAGVTWEPVRCQKICSGPVLGLVVSGKLQWFEKLRGKDARRALRRFLSGGKSKPLWKHRVRSRAGKLR